MRCPFRSHVRAARVAGDSPARFTFWDLLLPTIGHPVARGSFFRDSTSHPRPELVHLRLVSPLGLYFSKIGHTTGLDLCRHSLATSRTDHEKSKRFWSSHSYPTERLDGAQSCTWFLHR